MGRICNPFPVMDDLLGSIPGRHGTSLMRRKEVDAIERALKNRLLSSTFMLEVGTYEGVTASLLAEKCPNCVILSVDPFIDHDPRPGSDCQTPRPAPNRLANWFRNKRANQRLWVGTLAELYAVASHNFDFILVDGSHLYQDVLSDLRYASEMLLPDGVLAVHDYRETEVWGEVKQAAGTFLESSSFGIERVVESMAILRRKLR